MRTRGFSKDVLMIMGLNLAKDFEQAFYWKDKKKYQDAKKRLLKLDALIEKKQNSLNETK